MNFLLVTVDSLRADHVGYTGYSRDTTPFLDELSEDSAFFDNAVAPSTHTREALPSILTGQYPPQAVNRIYGMTEATVAEHADSEGFDTGAFVGGPFFTEGNGYLDGFDEFDTGYPTDTVANYVNYFTEIAANSHFRDGYTVNEALDSFVADADDEFFCWAHYMDAHGPYNRFDHAIWGEEAGDRRLQMLYRKAKYLPSTVTGEQRQTLIDHYDNGVRYFDGVMEDLFRRLRSQGALEDTLVFVTADHGESFGENGTYEHRRTLNPELLHVPLWVLGPDVPAEDRGERVSTVDVFPTIVEHLDVEASSAGAPLFDDVEERSREIRASCLNFFRREEKQVAHV